MSWEKKNFKTTMVRKIIEQFKTSHILLSKEYTFDPSDCTVEVPSDSCVQQTEGTHVTPPTSNSDSEAPLSRCCTVKEQQGECQSSARCNYPKHQ